MPKDKFHYITNLKCNNCNYLIYNDEGNISIEVPKGTLVTDFIKEMECKTCGCKNTIEVLN